MLQPPITVPIAFVRGMVSGITAKGQSGDVFLHQAGIAPELIFRPGARVTAAQYAALFRVLIEGLDDECLGLLSRPLKRGSLALMTRSALGAPTLEIAVRRVASAFRLLQDDFLIDLVPEDEVCALTLRLVNPSFRDAVFLHELLLRVFWRVLAWLAGGSLPATRFDFAFAMPAHADGYEKIFPAPLHFGQPNSAFWFSTGYLKGVVRRDEAALKAFIADAQHRIIAPRRAEELLTSRVRATLQDTAPAWPELSAVAESLHMAPSTMQRRLAQEGTSFQALKDGLRRDLAIVRLNTTMVPLAALASELGFADSPAFQRAFKGWTGSPPGAYRRAGS